MALTDTPTTPAIAAMRDDTTRNLCAAAHLSPAFADGAIREFLVERTRAVPPSPGIDAVTVLREAVAARERRLVRDWVLLGLLVVLLFASPLFMLGWAVVGVALWFGGTAREQRPLPEILAETLLPALATVGAFLLVELWELVTGEPSADTGVVAFVVPLLALAVLILDRAVVGLLLNRSFQRGRFVASPDTDTWRKERTVRTAGHGRYQADLNRVAQADAYGNLVVYRGYEPFVGGGSRLRPISLVISLDPVMPTGGHANGAGPTPFALRELYEHVSTQLVAMRRSLSLSPSARLASLTVHDQILSPVKDLLANYDDPATRVVLPSLLQPPRQRLTPPQVAEVLERPREWLRYYRCYRVETWNRELAVSGYLHFGASDRQLYLEWIPCLLLPIAESLRLRDSGPSIRWVRLVLRGAADLVRLPGDLLFRLGGLVPRIRPLAETPGVVRPEKYGTALSLRELAAGGRAQNYFQDSDAERYMELLSTRMLRAVGEFLEQKGISVTDFMSQAANIINNFGDNYGVNNFGAMGGGNNFGPPNKAPGARAGSGKP